MGSDAVTRIDTPTEDPGSEVLEAHPVRSMRDAHC
jgi:hypothetical protein